MHKSKIITRILLILPIINFAFALPIAEQETRQVCADVVPDVATRITMPAKRGDEEKAPDHGSMDLPQVGTSEIQQVSPGLSKSPSEASLDHYLVRPASEASLDHYVLPSASEDSFASAQDSLVSTDPKPASSRSTMKSFLRKVVSKFKFWRRISAPVSVRDAANAARRELQGLVDTGATMVRDIGRSLNVPPTPATRGVYRPGAGKPS